MTTYTGVRIGLCVLVRVDNEPLCPRLDLFPHSPNGFDWGHRGSGPAQLALAILADHLPSDENRALAHYQRFKERVIARLASDRWTLTDRDVDDEVAANEASDSAAA